LVHEPEKNMATILEQAMHLTVEEKFELISALWDSMAENPQSVPLPGWQLKELERRIEEQQQDPQPGQSHQSSRGILRCTG
jgi:putative addiction module component (TIGR02574 family)